MTIEQLKSVECMRLVTHPNNVISQLLISFGLVAKYKWNDDILLLLFVE